MNLYIFSYDEDFMAASLFNYIFMVWNAEIKLQPDGKIARFVCIEQDQKTGNYRWRICREKGDGIDFTHPSEKGTAIVNNNGYIFTLTKAGQSNPHATLQNQRTLETLQKGAFGVYYELQGLSLTSQFIASGTFTENKFREGLPPKSQY